MVEVRSTKFTTIMLSVLIAIFVLGFLYARVITLRSLRIQFEEKNQIITELTGAQEDQAELLDQINMYRDGLYALNLLLEARKNVMSGSDPENPYLVFNFTTVLNDLRQLLPRDSRVTKFQVNNKGLVTLPIESVDYASLGRVLKSFKDSSYNVVNRDENIYSPKIFEVVKIPSGAQRTEKQTTIGWRKYVENIYSFVLQAELNSDFWKNPMPYPDVDPHAYYAQAIRDLTIAGTIEGYPDGYFRPNNAMNRAEFFKVALFEFLSNDTISIEEYKRYIDLSEKDWHYQYIQLASQMGIAEGDEVGRFHPDQTISRVEALKTILTIFEVDLESEAEEDDDEDEPIVLPFVDIAEDSDSYSIIKAAFKEGLLEHAGEKLQPGLPVSRAEVSYWVWKLKFDYL
jgi:hypothetical protein